MKSLTKALWAPALVLCALIAPAAHAAPTTPDLGTASTFGILAHTFAVNGNGTNVITGDLGYSNITYSSGQDTYTATGATHAADSAYTQAGADQAAALAALNSQTCTFTFTSPFQGGFLDLATDTTHGTLGVYTPGVYCVPETVAYVNIGASGITLNGSGTYIFRINGSLITAGNSVVTLENGASACDVFWTPVDNAMLSVFGYASTFIGTVIDTQGFNVHDSVVWQGRGLAYGGNVYWASNESISVPTSCTPPPPAQATLHVIKTFYNDYGGTAVPSDANVHVKNGMGDVAGSPQAGAATPGTSYTLNADTYAVSEDTFAGYTPTFGGDCDTNGNVTLAAGATKTCIISNDQNPPQTSPATLHVIKHVINNDGGTLTASSFTLHVKSQGGGGWSDIAGSPAAGAEAPGTAYTMLNAGTYAVSEDTPSGYTQSFSGDCDSNGNITLASGDNKNCTITNDDIAQGGGVTPPPATLHVIKHVVNTHGDTASASSFMLHVKGYGSFGLNDVAGSPAAGAESPGTSYTLAAGTYAVSEDAYLGYAQSFGGDCDDGGNIVLAAGDDKTCTVTNNDTATPSVQPATLHVIKTVINDNGGTAVSSEAVIHVKSSLGDVAGSPQAGAASPGTPYVLSPGTYTVSENFFAGYTVAVGGDCDASGDVTLAPGDNKTCTITNNDIAGIKTPPVNPPPVKPPPPPAGCDICSKLTYDLYIINPNLSERHTGTAWVRVTNRGNNILRYSFEDATLDPHNPLYDYNDSVIDVDYTDCKNVKFMFVSSDASWKHQVRIKVSINGVTQSNTLITDDSKAAVGTTIAIDATTGVNTNTACVKGSSPTPSLGGRILLQVQQHGEAWYVHPASGLRYYMKDGPTAYGMMRNFGLGITDADLAGIPSVQTVDELKNSTSACASNTVANKVKGWILLQVQQHGEAWYVDVTKCRRIYMKDGAAAYTLMRFLGLGITDADLAKLQIGQ